VKLQNVVTIPAPPDEVFALINDVERVATCVPGAALTGQDGDIYSGGVKVSVGPISAAYNGKLRFLSVDETGRQLILEGKGADSHGNGDAQAHIELAVDQVEGGSQLRVDTDLILSGKIVAFGKGAIVAVSDKIMAQFAANLAALLESGSATNGAASTHAAGKGAPVARAAPAVASDAGLDLMSMIPARTKTAAAYTGVFLAGVIEGWLIARAFRKS
jgi:carbon monoxide dehydrogenase subunit G